MIAFRYRGYIYDTETGLYYLKTRYYDPEVGRFINADALMSTGQGVIGCNMFCYCLNNPVNMADSDGDFAITLTTIIVTSIVSAVTITLTVDYAINQEKSMVGVVAQGTYEIAEATFSIAEVTYERIRSKNRIGRRKRYNSKKKAREAAKRAGRGKEPIHHPHGEHGPHYHPNVDMPTNPTPKSPLPHDHYYYGGIGGLINHDR